MISTNGKTCVNKCKYDSNEDACLDSTTSQHCVNYEPKGTTPNLVCTKCNEDMILNNFLF